MEKTIGNDTNSINITYFGFLNDFVPFRVENGVIIEEKPKYYIFWFFE